MARKTKERELTRDEAVAMARSHLAPIWFGGPALFTGVRSPKGASVFPLDPEFAARNWIVGLIDPTCLSAMTDIQLFKDLHRRYHAHHLDFLLLLRATYGYLKQPQSIESLLKPLRLDFRVGVDPDGSAFEAFGAVEPPRALLVEKGKMNLEAPKGSWVDSIEARIQVFLRKNDCGLALFAPFNLGPSNLKDAGGFDFGDRSKSAMLSGLHFQGQWKREAERISTVDPKASIVFNCQGSELGIVAETLDTARAAAELAIELDGSSVRESHWGPDLGRTEQGLSGLNVTLPRNHYALKKLPAGAREIMIRFPEAERAGAALYGLRFADSK